MDTTVDWNSNTKNGKVNTGLIEGTGAAGIDWGSQTFQAGTLVTPLLVAVSEKDEKQNAAATVLLGMAGALGIAATNRS